MAILPISLRDVLLPSTLSSHLAGNLQLVADLADEFAALLGIVRGFDAFGRAAVDHAQDAAALFALGHDDFTGFAVAQKILQTSKQSRTRLSRLMG